MSRCLTSSLRASLRFYSSKSDQVKDKYVARLMPKRILKASQQTPNLESEEKIEAISKAVQKYLDNYKKNVEFFDTQDKEFQQGKRHLANMMGLDPLTITQEQIDKAIKYLFPSGLFETKHALPVMKPPSEIHPKFKTAQYNRDGRPFSSFFYTGKPNFYETLFDLYHNYAELNQIEDENIRNGILPTKEDKFDEMTHKILERHQLSNLFVEDIRENHYERFVNHLTRLMQHPYSARKSDFILKFVSPKIQQKVEEKIYTLKIDEEGKEYSEGIGGRNTVECLVKVYNNGTGKFSINDTYTMNFFQYFYSREQILTPLIMSDLIDKVDIYCYIEPIHKPLQKVGFQTTYAGAIRHGLTKAICAFVDDETKELLRLNGLLQHDVRKRERKKPGRHRARKGKAYRKR